MEYRILYSEAENNLKFKTKLHYLIYSEVVEYCTFSQPIIIDHQLNQFPPLVSTDRRSSVWSDIAHQTVVWTLL